MRWKQAFYRGLALLLGPALMLSYTPAAQAVAPPDANSVLILDPTVSGGAGSLEATKAAGLGYTVVVATAADWAATTAAEFGGYRALIMGDPTCVTGTTPVAAAEANSAVWGPEVDGNVVVVGTDPTFHQSQGGDQLTESGIAFAADIAGKTGAYITTSCYYHGTVAGTPVPVLDPFGSFTAAGVPGCFNDAHIVAVHPALAGLTDANLSGWGCSVHNAFDSFPADFLPLAIANGVGGPGSLNFADGSFGIPYIIARGETIAPILCGNGLLEGAEECDDGNNINGDGCSAACTIELPVCGDGNVDPGEQCDDGNTDDGDGCSSICTIENNPPDCSTASADPANIWPPNHKMVSVVIGGVTDPDGDAVTVTVDGVSQDEAVNVNGNGAGNTAPDATLSPLAVRAERNGDKKTPGDGRVYHIDFTADDGEGGSCTGSVSVCVPHDQGGSSSCVDGGPLFDSTVP